MPSPSCGAGRRHPLDPDLRRRRRVPERGEPDARMAACRPPDGGQPLRAAGGDPLPRGPMPEEHGSVLRRWGWFWALAPLGAASVAYVVIVRGFIVGDTVDALAWPLLGILPLFALGIWLLTVSTSRSALYIALDGHRDRSSAAVFDAFVSLEPRRRPRADGSPLFNVIGLTLAAIAAAAFMSMFATFPTGVPERRWQRIAVGFLWVPVAGRRRSRWSSLRSCSPREFDEVGVEGIADPFAMPALGLGGARRGVDRHRLARHLPRVGGADRSCVLRRRCPSGAHPTHDVGRRSRSPSPRPLWQAVPHREPRAGGVSCCSPRYRSWQSTAYSAMEPSTSRRARGRGSSRGPRPLLITVLYGIAVASAGVMLADSPDRRRRRAAHDARRSGPLPLRGWMQLAHPPPRVRRSRPAVRHAQRARRTSRAGGRTGRPAHPPGRRRARRARRVVGAHQVGVEGWRARRVARRRRRRRRGRGGAVGRSRARR